MSVSADEEEHSLEMMLPYIARVMSQWVTEVTIPKLGIVLPYIVRIMSLWVVEP